jgi:hypothetical protein
VRFGEEPGVAPVLQDFSELKGLRAVEGQSVDDGEGVFSFVKVFTKAFLIRILYKYIS